MANYLILFDYITFLAHDNHNIVGTWKSAFSVPPFSALVTVCMYNGCQTTYFRKWCFSLANLFYFPYIYLKHVGEVTKYKRIYLFFTSANFVFLF